MSMREFPAASWNTSSGPCTRTGLRSPPLPCGGGTPPPCQGPGQEAAAGAEGWSRSGAARPTHAACRLEQGWMWRVERD